MTDEEGFLARWNRRKRAAQVDADPRTESQGNSAEPASAPEDPQRIRPAAAAACPAAPDFDPASLPPIASITAASDIRAFLAPGVPEELTRAALRRAWSADPAIRDFVGIAENQWDFTAPNDILGFGPLESGEDVRRLVAKVFGDVPPAPDGEANPGLSGESDSQKLVAPPAAESSLPHAPEADAKSIVQRNENMSAPQDPDRSAEEGNSALPLRHGGALPR
jgi:hypothetical protein